MKRYTTKQEADLSVVEWFIPEVLKDVIITDDDRDSFLSISERGIYPKHITQGLNALLEGKRWRGIHIHELYEPGILDGSVPYYMLLGKADDRPMPPNVVEFLKKETFKGKMRI